MSLKRKELSVLKMIHEGKDTKEILTSIDTGERNLRYFIENLNFYLKKFLDKIIERDKKKFKLSLSKEELENFYHEIYKNHYILEQRERVEVILATFLFIKNVKLSTLEKSLGITRATLKKDIEEVNKVLEEYELKLEANKNRFSVNGNEKKYRQLKTKKSIYYKTIHGPHWCEGIDFLSGFDKKFMEKLRGHILEIGMKFGVEFKSDFINLMECFLYITLERISEGHILDRKINYDFLINTKYYKIIEESLAEYIDKELTYELVHMTEYFISGGANENVDELCEGIEKYICSLFKVLKENLKENLNYNILGKRLREYLIPTLYMLKNNFSIKVEGRREKIFTLVEMHSVNERFLLERLTENEVLQISKIILEEIEKENRRVIELKELLEIIEKNTTNLNKEKLIEELLDKYGDLIKVGGKRDEKSICE